MREALRGDAQSRCDSPYPSGVVGADGVPTSKNPRRVWFVPLRTSFSRRNGKIFPGSRRWRIDPALWPLHCLRLESGESAEPVDQIVKQPLDARRCSRRRSAPRSGRTRRRSRHPPYVTTLPSGSGATSMVHVPPKAGSSPATRVTRRDGIDPTSSRSLSAVDVVPPPLSAVVVGQVAESSTSPRQSRAPQSEVDGLRLRRKRACRGRDDRASMAPIRATIAPRRTRPPTMR